VKAAVAPHAAARSIARCGGVRRRWTWRASSTAGRHGAVRYARSPAQMKPCVAVESARRSVARCRCVRWRGAGRTRRTARSRIGIARARIPAHVEARLTRESAPHSVARGRSVRDSRTRVAGCAAGNHGCVRQALSAAHVRALRADHVGRGVTARIGAAIRTAIGGHSSPVHLVRCRVASAQRLEIQSACASHRRKERESNESSCRTTIRPPRQAQHRSLHV